MATPSEIQRQLDLINDDRSRTIVISHVIVMPLAIIAVTLRFVSRRMCKASIKADDYMIIIALVGLSSKSSNTLLGSLPLIYFSWM